MEGALFSLHPGDPARPHTESKGELVPLHPGGPYLSTGAEFPQICACHSRNPFSDASSS